MPASPFLPENVAEVASIHVSVGMGEEGTGCSYEYDGLSAEAAIGYLTTVIDQLREEVRMKWDTANGDEWHIHSVHMTCPECGEDIHIEPEYDEDDEEDGE